MYVCSRAVYYARVMPFAYYVVSAHRNIDDDDDDGVSGGWWLRSYRRDAAQITVEKNKHLTSANNEPCTPSTGSYTSAAIRLCQAHNIGILMDKVVTGNSWQVIPQLGWLRLPLKTNTNNTLRSRRLTLRCLFGHIFLFLTLRRP